MSHSANHLRTSRYALYLPACLVVCLACSEDTTTGPEGSTSGDSSSSGSSSSTSTGSSTASTTSTTTAASTGTSGQTGNSTGASGQSGTSSGPSGGSGTSSSTSGGSGTSNSTSGGSGASSSTSSASSSGSSGGSASTSAGGSDDNSGSDSSSGSGATSGGDGEFTLTSTAHEDGAEFDDKYTCEGKSFFDMVIPPLEWANPPEGTMSYAITFIDTFIIEDDSIDDMLGYHWAMVDIPADVTSIAEGMEAAVEGARRIGGQQGSFFGPCPDGREDTYAFTIHAIPTATLTFQGSSVANAVAAIEEASIGSAVLTGVSAASPM